MMLRRTFESPDGFVLVTVHVETGEVIAAVRSHQWDTWSRPLPECDRHDDVERGRVRHMRHAYDDGGMLVVPVVDGSNYSTGTVTCTDEVHGDSTTGLYDGAGQRIGSTSHCSRCGSVWSSSADGWRLTGSVDLVEAPAEETSPQM